MDLLDCPHCFTSVVPMQDGLCPSCRRDVRAAPASRERKGQVVVAPTTQLPPICCDCGEPTTRLVAVRRVRYEARESWFVRFLLGGLMFMLRRGMENADGLQAAVPQCDLCAARGAPAPVHVDFDNARMTFTVNSRLKSAVGQA